MPGTPRVGKEDRMENRDVPGADQREDGKGGDIQNTCTSVRKCSSVAVPDMPADMPVPSARQGTSLSWSEEAFQSWRYTP